jgi:hypothetical protein
MRSIAGIWPERRRTELGLWTERSLGGGVAAVADTLRMPVTFFFA